MKQIKVLFITKHNPFGIGGGCYASYAYLKAFSIIFNGQIDLCIADSIKYIDQNIAINNIYKVKQRSILNRILSIFTGELHRYTSFVKRLLKHNFIEYTHCVFDHNSISGSLVKYVSELGIVSITIHHNYEPEYFTDNTSNFIVRNLFYRHVVKAEKTAYINSNFNLFLTKSDLTRFIEKYEYRKTQNLVIGCFEKEDSSSNMCNKNDKSEPGKPITIVISGSLVSYQTENGLVDFFENLYPVVASTRFKIIITGKNPSETIRKKCKLLKNVELISNPDNIQDIVKMGDIYLCPTKIGGGLKLRIMDGLKNGLCVITHDISARGYDCFFDKPFFQIYNNKTNFEKALINTIKVLESNQFSKYGIKKIYYENFSFQNGVKRLRNILDLDSANK